MRATSIKQPVKLMARIWQAAKLRMQRRQLLHNRRLACATVLSDAALGILSEGLFGLRTDVALFFALGSFLLRGCLLGSLSSFGHKNLLSLSLQTTRS
jgi:hypothetical protein